jgi:hypothetical protein
MANRIFPTIAPFIRAIFGQDDNDDFRVARVDYNGGLLAGPFGAYGDVWNEYVTQGFASGGSVSISTSAVPTGYLYIVQSVLINHSDATARQCRLVKYSGGTDYRLYSNESQSTSSYPTFTATLTLKAGEYLAFRLYNGSANVFLLMWVCGYKVRLT